MSVKISRRVLEAALRQMMNEAEPAAAPGTDPAPPPTQPAPTPATQPPAQEPSDIDKFKAQVDKLNKMKDGDEVSAGSDKFVKRSGSWYIASVGGQQGLDKDGLLSLVKDDAKEDVTKKIEKDQSQNGTLGVTIRGEQFIEQGADKGANFKIGEGGLYRDISPIPVQILAQYYFDEELGQDVSGAVKADISGVSGEKALVYRSDELVFVIDRGQGNFYVMSEGNNETNALQATADLLAKIDPNKRIASTGATYKGFKRKSGTDQSLASLENLRKYLVPDQSGTPFDVRISNFKFIGDLQKAIAGRRTLISKFVDIFQRDEIEMSFAFTKWGPAFMRARVFGSRGISGGGGALTDADMDALAATGLFREENLPLASDSVYIPQTDKRQSFIDPVMDANVVVEIIPVRGPGGVKVTSVSTLGNALTDTQDKYTDTYADAYFLFSSGVLSPKAAPEAAPEPPASAPQVSGPAADPREELKKRFITPLGSAEGAIYYDFNSSSSYEQQPANYIESVIKDLEDIAAKAKGIININSVDMPLIALIATADPKGEVKYNYDLAVRRAKPISDQILAAAASIEIGGQPISISVAAVGEIPWEDSEATYNGLDDNKRKPLRFVKAYLASEVGDKEMTEPKAVELAKQFATGKVATSASEQVRAQVKDVIREMFRKQDN